MGLDMYLTKSHYVKQWDHQPPDDRYSVLVERGDKPVDYIKPERISGVTEEIAYWRKANAIHKWFVDNVQDGKDDCGSYYVSRDDLKRLLEVVTKVLDASKLVDGKIANGSRLVNGEWEPVLEDGKYIENPAVAQELLPCQDGFFFGGTAYDQWYYRDLEYTKKVLEEAIAEDGYGDFEYRSSW